MTSARASATRCCCPPDSSAAVAFPCPADARARPPRARVRDLRRATAAHLEAEGDVLRDGHVREQRVALEDEPHVAPVGRHAGQILAADEDLAARLRRQARDHPQRRRLAAARGPEERDQLALRHVELDVVDREEVVVALRQSAQRQESVAGLSASAAFVSGMSPSSG